MVEVVVAGVAADAGGERVVGVVETLVVSSCGAVAVVPGCGMGVGGVGTVAGAEMC